MNGQSLQLHTYGGLFLAARLRRLSELLYAGTDGCCTITASRSPSESWRGEWGTATSRSVASPGR